MSASQMRTFKELSTNLDVTMIEYMKLRTHKSKSSARNCEATTKPKKNKVQGQNNKRTGEDFQQQLFQTPNRDRINSNEQDKAARRAARKQARKEKWANMRATFKRIAKKTGEGLILAAGAVGGIIVVPVIVAADFVFIALCMVVEVVLRILGFLFCPVLVCFACFTDLEL